MVVSATIQSAYSEAGRSSQAVMQELFAVIHRQAANAHASFGHFDFNFATGVHCTRCFNRSPASRPVAGRRRATLAFSLNVGSSPM